MTKQQIDWREEFDEKFADPMTKKYGEGFALYCSFCKGEWRNEIKDFISQTIIFHLSEVKEAVEGTKVKIPKHTDNVERIAKNSTNATIELVSYLLSEKIKNI